VLVRFEYLTLPGSGRRSWLLIEWATPNIA
jgi:hypothetical protein